jgi:hypothetical protein
MQPAIWKPEVTLSLQEEQIVKKIRKAKLFVFLRYCQLGNVAEQYARIAS